MAFDLNSGKRGVRPTMNVTPLVDVVLVLLIIFMVITPMMVKQLSVNVPSDKSKPGQDDSEEPEPQVILRVAQDGSVFVNRDAVLLTELDPKLRRVFAARDDQTLFFDADDRVDFGRAMEVLDAARGVGIGTIAVLPQAVIAE